MDIRIKSMIDRLGDYSIKPRNTTRATYYTINVLSFISSVSPVINDLFVNTVRFPGIRKKKKKKKRQFTAGIALYRHDVLSMGERKKVLSV